MSNLIIRSNGFNDWWICKKDDASSTINDTFEVDQLPGDFPKKIFNILLKLDIEEFKACSLCSILDLRKFPISTLLLSLKDMTINMDIEHKDFWIDSIHFTPDTESSNWKLVSINNNFDLDEYNEPLNQNEKMILNKLGIKFP